MPITPPIAGLDHLGPQEGVHLLHSMGDTFALMQTLEQQDIGRAVIVGAGYVGLEMAEALVARGVTVTQIEQLPEVLPTVDYELGALVRAELRRHDVEVSCDTRVDAIQQLEPGSTHRLEVSASGPDGHPLRFRADLVLLSVGVHPDSKLAANAGAELETRGAGQSSFWRRRSAVSSEAWWLWTASRSANGRRVGAAQLRIGTSQAWNLPFQACGASVPPRPRRVACGGGDQKSGPAFAPRLLSHARIDRPARVICPPPWPVVARARVMPLMVDQPNSIPVPEGA